MEKNLKRKMPARAAARGEQAAKRRNITPSPAQNSKSSTPTPAPEPELAPAEDAPPPLPKSITAGKPLPTVNSPQPDDLSSKDYQTVTERYAICARDHTLQTSKKLMVGTFSGVLSESLTRSRQTWITEGIFERYWVKPTKKKGVVIEDPNNPPKESMTKLCQVTITIEPHVFEATMYAVKDPKPPPPPVSNAPRPVIQYGPPNGVLPPPVTPKPMQPVAASPTPTQTPQPQLKDEANQPNQPQPHTQSEAQAPPPSGAPIHPPAQVPVSQAPAQSNHAAAPISVAMPRPVASPRGMESVLSPTTVAPQPPRPPVPASPAMSQQPPYVSSGPSPSLSKTPVNGTSAATAAGASGKPAPGTDPIILMLAEKAGADPMLRDLMKKVAQGEATKVELERFQGVIDALTAESKRRGTSGPSADRLIVEGRSVRYFADEVRSILDIVLRSNPKQTSADLKPPADSDPLVVALVKEALDDVKTRELVRRISEDRTQFLDSTTLKATLERLQGIVRSKQLEQQTKSPVPGTSSVPPKVNGTPNGTAASSATTTPQPQQALRSKGPPPPPPKPDISAIVFEFAGGTGDRYLFPKFSIVEQVPLPQGAGQQVLCSFLLVRRGSKSEYPQADPDLDYYQPVTIRLFTPTGRHLDHLSRVVAPQAEVQKYMDDVMDKMTRAEYVLLAMRLPRSDGTEPDGKDSETATNGVAAITKEKEAEVIEKEKKGAQNPMAGVLWATKPPRVEMRELSSRSRVYSKDMDLDDGDEQYQSFISTVSGKGGQE